MPTITINGGLKLIGGQITTAFINIPPTWSTTSGSLGFVKEFDTITSGGFFILAVDPDNLPVTPVVYDIIAGALPTGATLDATTGVITGPAVPVASDTIFNFTARVSDGQDQVTRAFSITVLDNVAPMWTTPVGSLGSRHEAETITSGNFTVIATDPDSGPGALTYSLSTGTLPTGASLNTSTGDITGPAVTVGLDTTYNFTIDATDTDKTTNRAFSITVDNNTVPVWQTSNAAPLVTVDTGVAVNTTVTATDADSLPMALTYSVAVGSLPAGLSLNSSTGDITGTPTVATTIPFTIEANDGLDGTQRQFQIVVNQAGSTISNSVIFNDDDTSYLARTPGSAGDTKTFTISTWFKFANVGQTAMLYSGRSTLSAPSNAFKSTIISTGEMRIFNLVGAATDWELKTTRLFRDPSAWYHIVISMDTTQATASNRLKLYINGVQETNFSIETYPALNQTTEVNSNVEQTWGVNRTDGGAYNSYLDGYLAESIVVDGQQLTSTDFGFFDDNGDWQPINYSGIYGTNGFRLDYAVAPGTGNGAGTDVSGNVNHFTDVNLVATDQVSDTPTINYPTGNAVKLDPDITLSAGNLKTVTSVNDNHILFSTMALPNTGKYYWEITYDNDSGGTGRFGSGIGLDSLGLEAVSTDAASWIYLEGGTKVDTSSSAYGSVFNATDVVGNVFDADAGTLTFYLNGVSQGIAFTGLTGGPYFPIMLTNFSSYGTMNFGASAFSQTQVAGTTKLNSSNLSTPAIADPGLFMNTITYNGTGASNALTGVGFQPDFNWIKKRSAAESHNLVDSVRGVGSNLASDTNAIQDAVSRVASLDVDGFTVNNDVRVNTSAQAYVAWNWKKSVTAGFDIINPVLANTASQTISHNLGVKPDFIIGKFQNISGEWAVYHSSLGATKFMRLNTNGVVATSANKWNNVEPTSTLITLGLDFQNASSFSGIFYAFTSVEGFSKFGTYIGNGSTDGPFVYCGFRPAFVLWKDTGGLDFWYIHDAVRSIANPSVLELNPNSTEGEGGGSRDFDMLSNGFNCRSTDTHQNRSGGTFIFAAFAESPFKTSRAR